MSPKDWDKIVRELSSGEDSDAGDSLNVQSVAKNARRVAELMQSMAPAPNAPSQPVAPPLGANRPLPHSDLVDAARAAREKGS